MEGIVAAVMIDFVWILRRGERKWGVTIEIVFDLIGFDGRREIISEFDLGKWEVNADP